MNFFLFLSSCQVNFQSLQVHSLEAYFLQAAHSLGWNIIRPEGDQGTAYIWAIIYVTCMG